MPAGRESTARTEFLLDLAFSFKRPLDSDFSATYTSRRIESEWKEYEHGYT